jgi:Uma2 family endonuclease
MIAVRKRLITAEQFSRMPTDGRPAELVRGRIEHMMLPAPLHGWYCGRVVGFFIEHRQKHKTGNIFCNDSAIITERDPDTVRGADVAYFSYKRVGKGKLPKGYLPAAPEAVFEIRSPSDRAGKLLTKVGEYLAAGVNVVCVIDPESETITVYEGDKPPQTLGKGAILDLSRIIPGFRVPVVRFFEED